jgi:hypothetical protein
MLVRLGWSNCDYIDRQPDGLPQDAYWVECTAEEGLPLLAAHTDNLSVPLETFPSSPTSRRRQQVRFLPTSRRATPPLARPRTSSHER